jgi:hypothetical protein
MTPKEKAKELIEWYSMLTGFSVQSLNGWMLREMATFLVDEILNSNPIEPNNSKPFGVKIQSVRQNFIDADNYWNEVRKELKLL